MTAALGNVAMELKESNSAGDFSKVMPFVQRRVAVELDLELVGTVSEIRWTHLKGVEHEIVEGAETLAQQVRAGTALPPETFEQLMVHREAILSDARLEAERLMMEAMTRSAETMAQAEQAQASTMLELEKEKGRILADLREQAYQDGFNEGKQAGEQQAAQYVTEALTKLNEIAVAFPTAVKKNEERLVTLALEIAKKIIQDEIAIQPELVQRTVETSLKRVSDLEQVVVKVNPLDLDLILPKQETFKQIVPDVQNFSIEGSHTIPRGGCVIETNSGSINATLNAQLSIIEEMFKNVRAEYEEEVLGELS
jgi:flagellar assembly protein FliH